MLICHIVGLNYRLKEEFYNLFENKFLIFDIDDIFKKILLDEEYLDLINMYNDPDTIGYRKEILHELSEIWKKIMDENLQSIIDISKTKDTIIIGLSNFVMDQRIKIDIPTKHKFFIDINTNTNAENIIEYYIKKFKGEIIKGIFPLKNLDKQFLISQRNELIKIYMNRNYTKKNLDTVYAWLNDFNNTKIKLPSNIVYVASRKRFEDTIPEFNKLFGYTELWLALSSIVEQQKIKKGTTYLEKTETSNNLDKQFFIKELEYGIFDNFKIPCYIYEIEPKKKIDKYKYQINEKIINRKYISNIYNELIRLNIRLDKYEI